MTFVVNDQLLNVLKSYKGVVRKGRLILTTIYRSTLRCNFVATWFQHFRAKNQVKSSLQIVFYNIAFSTKIIAQE